MFGFATPATKSFQLQGDYHCPICRHGQIAAIPLMEALGCNLCGRIFLADLAQQSLTTADSASPLTWYWNGQRWQGIPRRGIQLGWGAMFVGLGLVALPTLVVGLSAYLFAPMPGSTLSWFPFFWTGFTFCSHLVLVLYLIGDYYQFPLWAYLRMLRRAVLGRLIIIRSFNSSR
jgi:hypothetical protein